MNELQYTVTEAGPRLIRPVKRHTVEFAAPLDYSTLHKATAGLSAEVVNLDGRKYQFVGPDAVMAANRAKTLAGELP